MDFIMDWIAKHKVSTILYGAFLLLILCGASYTSNLPELLPKELSAEDVTAVEIRLRDAGAEHRTEDPALIAGLLSVAQSITVHQRWGITREKSEDNGLYLFLRFITAERICTLETINPAVLCAEVYEEAGDGRIVVGDAAYYRCTTSALRDRALPLLRECDWFAAYAD